MDLEAETLNCEVMTTIFSPEPIDLRTRHDDRPGGGDDDEDGGDDDDDANKIEVIDPTTGKIEKIARNDPSYYSASGFKARRYKGSSKPMDIPTFIWQSMSVKARKVAIEEEQKKIARIEAEKKNAQRSAAELKRAEKREPGVAAVLNQLYQAYHQDDVSIPAMPVCNYNPQRRREKMVRVTIHSGERIINTLVARPVNRKEIRANPKAQAALDVEWEKLVKKSAWLYDTVEEWSKISSGAKKSGKKVHVGKVFEICVGKGSELPEGHKLRKFKGRTVFQGNNVRDENADVALFSELGSSPATMEAGKAVDAYGCQPGFSRTMVFKPTPRR